MLNDVIDDFAFSIGRSAVINRRRAANGDWEEFPAVQTVTTHLDGKVLIEEIEFLMPNGDRPRGLAVFAHDDTTGQWSYVWINQRHAPDFRPMIGSFQDGVGELYQQTDDGHLRFIWNNITEDSAHWEQAESSDGVNWETNWTQDIKRINAVK